MSQAKVDKYKHDKANRKEIMKKEAAQSRRRHLIVALVAAIMVGWLGYSAYDYHQNNQPRQMAEIDYSLFDTYMNTIGE